MSAVTRYVHPEVLPPLAHTNASQMSDAEIAQLTNETCDAIRVYEQLTLEMQLLDEAVQRDYDAFVQQASAVAMAKLRADEREQYLRAMRADAEAAELEARASIARDPNGIHARAEAARQKARADRLELEQKLSQVEADLKSYRNRAWAAEEKLAKLAADGDGDSWELPFSGGSR